MSGASLTKVFEIDGFLTKLERLETEVKDARPLMNVIGTGLVSLAQDRLGGTRDPWGKPWAALSPAYARIKTQPGMLRVKGDAGGLSGSLTYEAGSNFVRYGSNKEYAGVHQNGATIDREESQVTVYRKTRKDGSFASKGRFVKRRQANLVTTHLTPAYSIVIPARPYLGIGFREEIMVGEAWEWFINRAFA